MRTLKHLFENNRRWAARVEAQQPGFFGKLAGQQAPQYLWIGCADSRVPANEIVDLAPGELFVHRNVANQVVHTDLNCLSVLQYAVWVLGVRHVIVCGHYGCGGVRAALEGKSHGLIDNWLLHITDLAHKHEQALEGLDGEARCDRLCEMNVIEQVYNVCKSTIVQARWAEGHDLAVHGWIYGLKDGLLRDLGVCITRAGELSEVYRKALGGTGEREAPGK